MAAMSALKIGIVGCGVIATAHASALRGLRQARLESVELAAAYDSDGERAERFARYFATQKAASVEEVIAACDAVYVCTPTRSHLEIVRLAAAAGRAVFCEKPLGRNLAEAVALADIAGGAGIPVQVGLVLRTAPVFRQLAAVVAGGRFGRPMAVIFRDDQFFPIQGYYASSWRSDATVAGSGVLLEHSIHDVDIMDSCFGPIESVSASAASLEGYEGIEDTVSAVLHTASGVPISLVTVWHQVRSRPSTRRVEVLFEEAFVTLDDDFTGPLTVQTSEGSAVTECRPPEWVLEVREPDGARGLGVVPYLEENRDFLEALGRERAPWPGLEEGVAAHRVVDACYRSAASGGSRVSVRTEGP
jgi:UDP-N-acetyl-2-amino-2-deoxyglucuronate dehydrogenase